MDFADVLDMMDDDCDIEGFPLEKRDCEYYTPNGDTYPLCKGHLLTKYECNKCSVYEDIDEDYI